jgi:TctA family transporter
VILFYEFIPFVFPDTTIDSLTIIYPAEDFILLVLVLVIVLKFRSGEIAKPWGLLALGVILDAIGDIWYTYLEWYGLSLTAYDWYDLFFTLSYIAMFTSGLYFLWLYRRR